MTLPATGRTCATPPEQEHAGARRAPPSVTMARQPRATIRLVALDPQVRWPVTTSGDRLPPAVADLTALPRTFQSRAGTAGDPGSSPQDKGPAPGSRGECPYCTGSSLGKPTPRTSRSTRSRRRAVDTGPRGDRRRPPCRSRSLVGRPHSTRRTRSRTPRSRRRRRGQIGMARGWRPPRRASGIQTAGAVLPPSPRTWPTMTPTRHSCCPTAGRRVGPARARARARSTQGCPY